MATANKLFTSGVLIDNSHVSKIRRDREYLLSDDVAKELNTYLNFGIFDTFNDVYVHQYDEKGAEISKENGPGTPGVRSIFNKNGAILIGTSTGRVTVDDVISNASEIRISNNVPLMDSPSNRQKIKENSGCSIKELVKASGEGKLGRGIYAYSDFMYCKHLGRISNNHLITLRRFPIPVNDFISSVGVGRTRTNEGKNNFGQQIGCLVTWMGTPGNEMGNLLKYSYNMPFKEQSAQWNQIDGGNADEEGGVLNSIAAAFDPVYRKQFQSGHGGAQYDGYINYINKFYNKSKYKIGSDPLSSRGRYDAAAEMRWRDDNKVYGPVDRVKKTYMRSDEGITFDQTFSITFDYELRSYNGINGRQAMLDLLSNILNVTYTTGDFWGGGYIGAGQHQNSLFTNMKIFKASGGLSGFTDAFMQDCSSIGNAIKGSLKNQSLLSMAKEAINQLGGMLLGGLLNKLGRPRKIFANSLLSEQPVGFWHLTVGNPFHPIISVGNLVLTKTTVEHYGQLGLDGFPTGLRVTCELTRGKPRDIREIEKMYMLGNDKIHYSMGPKVIDMYKNSEEYQKSRQNKASSKSSLKTTEIPTGENKVSLANLATTKLGDLTKDDFKTFKQIIRKTFGEDDEYSIINAAKEQDWGSQPRKSKK